MISWLPTEAAVLCILEKGSCNTSSALFCYHHRPRDLLFLSTPTSPYDHTATSHTIGKRSAPLPIIVGRKGSLFNVQYFSSLVRCLVFIKRHSLYIRKLAPVEYTYPIKCCWMIAATEYHFYNYFLTPKRSNIINNSKKQPTSLHKPHTLNHIHTHEL